MYLKCCSIVARKNTLACGSNIFTLSESLRYPSCMDHAILHGQPFGIPLVMTFSLHIFRTKRLFTYYNIWFLTIIPIFLKY
jgi:hypothetical protein